MNNRYSTDFESLLDSEYQQHIIEVMNEWCGNLHIKQNTARADLVEKEISKPLWDWMDQTRNTRKTGNYSDIEAVEAFASKADDIAYILRHNTRPLYPEHVAMLNDAWAAFQREMAHGLHVRNRILKEVIDSQPSIEAAVAEYLKQRSREEADNRKAKKQKACEIWQKAGADAAKKYTADDEKKWFKAAKKILKKNNRIKSIRQLAVEIEEELEYSIGAWETIRKTESINKLFKEHKLNNNIG